MLARIFPRLVPVSLIYIELWLVHHVVWVCYDYISQHFPALGARCTYLHRVVIGSSCCLRLLCLVSIFPRFVPVTCIYIELWLVHHVVCVCYDYISQHFPALCARCTYLHRVVIGSSCCLRLLWLVSIFPRLVPVARIYIELWLVHRVVCVCCD